MSLVYIIHLITWLSWKQENEFETVSLNHIWPKFHNVNKLVMSPSFAEHGSDNCPPAQHWIKHFYCVESFMPVIATDSIQFI